MFRYLVEENSLGTNSQLMARTEAMFGQFWKFVPWERARAERLVTLLTAQSYDRLVEVEELLADLGSYRDFTAGRGRSNFYDEGTSTREWLDTTLQVSAILPSLDFVELNHVSRVTARNAALLRMALIDYRREHGDLPESLDALKGAYFQELPVDPYSGKPFEYLPAGPSEPLEFTRPNDFVAEPGQPLLWSIGLTDAISAVLSGGRTVTKGYWAFPIPAITDEGAENAP
jgi:hypothetical protein